MRTVYAVAYLAGALWLLGWELSAFAIRRTDLTMSDLWWGLEGHGWTFARYVMLASLLWLLFHLVFGWFR